MSKNNISSADSTLFRTKVGAVKSIKNNHITPFRKALKPKIRRDSYVTQSIIQDQLSDEYEPISSPNDELWFARPGVQMRYLKKLKKGILRSSDILDLHGLTIPIARQTLLEFLNHCYSLELRFIRIIHGKGHHSHQGQAVLKYKLDNWLRQSHEVLAFCSANQKHGGTGAVNVLLRSSKKLR